MINFRQITRLSLITLLLSGCAATPPTSDNNTLAAAAEKILYKNVYYNEIFAKCAALGGEVEVDAINVQQDWLNANAKLVAAADNFYSQQQAGNSFEYAGLTLAPTAIRMALQASQEAQTELSLNKRSIANQQKTCSFMLAKMSDAGLSLTSDPQVANAQAGLMNEQLLDINALNSPRLAGNIKSIPAGKSYFSINKTHQNNCPDAYTLVIANDWPKEAYANFCGSKAMEVLLCDWGKCEAKKL
jgi:hypothetical protein